MPFTNLWSRLELHYKVTQTSILLWYGGWVYKEITNSNLVVHVSVCVCAVIHRVVFVTLRTINTNRAINHVSVD